MSALAPPRSSSSRRNHRLVAFVCASAIALAGILAAGPASAATPAYCGGVTFIGVRGTDAPAGATPAMGGRVWQAGGMGPQISVLANEVKKLGYPTYVASLNYSASGANYAGSVAEGSNKLAELLNWLRTTCGNAMPAVVLGGHSQGADVIGGALGWQSWPNGTELSSGAKLMVRAAALFGDPAYVKNRPINAPGSANSLQGIFPRNSKVATDIEKLNHWGWPMGGGGMGTVYRVRSWCLPNDYFCQYNGGSNDPDYTVHNSYKDKTMVTARDWIDYMLADNS